MKIPRALTSFLFLLAAAVAGAAQEAQPSLTPEEF
jgi:hypothetical protein